VSRASEKKKVLKSRELRELLLRFRTDQRAQATTA
jgi:hypothetical protein